MNWPNRVIDDIKNGENIDVYFTILVGIIAGILVFLPSSTAGIIGGLTLTVLCFLANSIVGTRHQIKELQTAVKESLNTVLLEDFPSSLSSDFERADELWIVGVTLSRTIKTYYSKIEQKLQKGHSVKILLVDPKGTTVDTVTQSPRPEIEQKKRYIEDVLKILNDLYRVNPSKLEVRLTKKPLTFGAFGIQPDTPLSGVIYIKYYTFRINSDGLPKFVLRAKDGHWFEFYRREIESKWEEAEQANFDE